MLNFISLQENSFLQNLGHLELDLPEAPEKATHPPLQPVDPASRFGPQSEISHIFRIAEKLPPKEVSLVFLCITLLPLIGFAIGVSRTLFRRCHILSQKNNIILFSHFNFVAGSFGGKFEKFPFFITTVNLRNPIPCWHCGCSLALCTFLAKGLCL